MINHISHARSYARELKRHLKPHGIGHLAAHDIAAKTIGMRDWRTLSMATAISASRSEVELGLRQQLEAIHGVDANAIVTSLLPPASVDRHTEKVPKSRRPHPDMDKVQERPLELLHAFNGKQLDNIYHAVRMEHLGQGGAWTKRMEECLKQGFFPRTAVEDVIDDCDHRLRIESIGMHIDRLMQCLGYSWENMTDRPLHGATSAMMFKAISAADMAGLLIVLERMGFEVPASAMVERMLPDIKKKKALTPSEISVFWYARERDRFHMRFVADDVDRAEIHNEGRLANGYRYEAMINGDQVRALEIYGSRYRRRPPEW